MELAPGTLRKLIRLSGLSVEQFVALLAPFVPAGTELDFYNFWGIDFVPLSQQMF